MTDEELHAIKFRIYHFYPHVHSDMEKLCAALEQARKRINELKEKVEMLTGDYLDSLSDEAI